MISTPSVGGGEGSVVEPRLENTLDEQRDSAGSLVQQPRQPGRQCRTETGGEQLGDIGFGQRVKRDEVGAAAEPEPDGEGVDGTAAGRRNRRVGGW